MEVKIIELENHPDREISGYNVSRWGEISRLGDFTRSGDLTGPVKWPQNDNDIDSLLYNVDISFKKYLIKSYDNMMLAWPGSEHEASDDLIFFSY